jgi:phosphoribosylglycinamide formyltransferase-1
MKKLLILASGAGTNAKNIIDKMKGTDVRVCGIISSNANAGVVEVARKEGLPCSVFSKEDIESGKLASLLRMLDPDLVVLAGFLLMVPKEVTDTFRVANVHPSLLPKFGGKGMHGMKVHQAVVAAGERESGITIHWANERYDEGEIIAQFRCDVSESDTPETLAAKIKGLELNNFPDTILDII